MRVSALACAVLAATGLFGVPLAAADLKVVATSKAAHSLTAAVMEGVGTPVLIVEGAASPHTFTMKPSAARAITSADVFVRVSSNVEPFTERIVEALPPSVTLVTLADVPGIELLERRSGATFEKDEHKGRGSSHDHDHDEHGHDGGADGHVWLDPSNARKMAVAIAAALSARYPGHKAEFEANAAALGAGIDAAAAEITSRMKPFAGRPFVVFHDATQYFERRFGLEAAGSITISPEVQPSARRLAAVRQKIKSAGAVCVFSEPAYQAKLVAAVTEGTDARAGFIDPEGLKLEPGPGLYIALMKALAQGFEACLGKAS